MRGRAAMVLLLAMTPATAFATLDDPATSTDAYTALCETIQICRDGSGCFAFPTLGQSLLRIQGTDGHIGPSEDNLDPVEVYQLPLVPPEDLDALGLRVLIEQPSDAVSRRFAFVDRSRAGPAGRYFLLECVEALE